MKIEKRSLTKAELERVTSRRPVVRRIPPPSLFTQSLTRIGDARVVTQDGEPRRKERGSDG
jgi:hypothetical protein